MGWVGWYLQSFSCPTSDYSWRLGCSSVGVGTISYSTLPLPPIIVGVMSDQTVQTPNNKSSPPVMVAICNTSGTFQLEQAYGYYIGVKQILLFLLYLNFVFAQMVCTGCSMWVFATVMQALRKV